MKVAVSLYGYGHEFSIGTISQEIWDYIQEKYDGDFDKYLDGLENGDVPEKTIIAAYAGRRLKKATDGIDAIGKAY